MLLACPVPPTAMSVDWRILVMFHTPGGRCLVALCFVLRWSPTAAARLSSTATQLEPVEQEINPSFADVDTYHTCELSEGIYTMSNLSEILCASDKRLKEIIEMHPNSSNKFVLAPTKPVRLVGKGGKGAKVADKVGIWHFSAAGRQSVPGSVAFGRKSWGPSKRDFNWSIQNVVPHTCELQCYTSSTGWETAGTGKVGDGRIPGSICKYLAGLADSSACCIDPPDPWESSVRWRFRRTKHQLQPFRFQVRVLLGRCRFPAGQRHLPHSVGRGWGWKPRPPVIPNAEGPPWGSRGRLQFLRISHWNQRIWWRHSGCRQDPVLWWPTGHSRGWTWRAQKASRSPGCEHQACFRWCRSLRFSKCNGLMEVHWWRFYFSHIFAVSPSAVQTDVRTQVLITGFDVKVRINNTNVSSTPNDAIFIHLQGDASDVKLDNIKIRDAGVGAYLDGKHLIAKNMDISHTQTGIVMDMDEAELEAVKMKDVRTGLKAWSAFRAKDLEISEAKVAAIDFATDHPSQATGVSISDCSVAVKCNHCESVSMDDVLIAGNVQALESLDGTNFQTSSGLVFFNSWNDTLTINQGKGANVPVWSRLPCPIAIASSYLACGLATILSRIALEQHFSGGLETSWYGQRRKYVLAGASLLLWIMVVKAVVAAFLLRTMRWTYAHQQQVHLQIVKPQATIWLTSLLALLTAAIVYLYITVVRRRLDIKTLADLKRTEMLLQQKDRSTGILLEFRYR